MQTIGYVDASADEQQLAMALEASLAIAAEQFGATPSDVRWVHIDWDRRRLSFNVEMAWRARPRVSLR